MILWRKQQRIGPGDTRSGVTLTELLVVLLIIGLLTTVAVPVYIGHAERARIRTAQLEVREIATAMEFCGSIHGFYVPIQLLDDLPGDNTASGADPQADYIQNESDSIYMVDVNTPIEQMSIGGIQPTLGLGRTGVNARVARLRDDWEGPFLSPQRIWDGSSRYLDHPLDPWNSPYRFFGPVGIIGSGASSIVSSAYNTTAFSDGQFTNQVYQLSRYAIVSLGPNGEFDDPFQVGTTSDGDDIIYYFGPVYTETTFTP